MNNSHAGVHYTDLKSLVPIHTHIQEEHYQELRGEWWKNSPRAAKRLKITGEHTKINIKPNSVMAVVPHHLPSKQIWSDCLIKPAALSAIHTCFLPAKYSIIHVKGLEKQADKGQSDLSLWCTNSCHRRIYVIYDPHPPLCTNADAKVVIV